MCGIVGVVSEKEINDKLFKGLSNLEYRGYDSVGMCFVANNRFKIKKGVGKLQEVHKKINLLNFSGKIGIGHCRWSTHGGVTKENAHPHVDCKNKISVVHNGIIENYSELKEELMKKGHKFNSQTDTEVIAHLIEDNLSGNKIEDAVRAALKRIEGSYALGILCADEPDKLIGARNESPLIVGIGSNENFIASDVPSILGYTNRIIYLDDKEMVILTKDTFKILDLDGKEKKKKINSINWSAEAAEKSGYKHFMLKEIYEQPRAIADTLNERVINGDVVFEKEFALTNDYLRKIDRIIILACGTSWHAALVGEFMLEELAKIPTEVEYASEFRYRHPLLDKNTLVVAISQSGETADTKEVLIELKRRGYLCLGIVNVAGSSIAREAGVGIYIRAGVERAVASTKAFTSQILALMLLGVTLARQRGMSTIEGKEILAEMEEIPEQLALLLKKLRPQIKKMA